MLDVRAACLILGLVLAFLTLPPPVYAQEATDPTETLVLEVPGSIERSFEGPETHAYSVDPGAATVLHVSVAQTAGNLAFAVYDPSGAAIARVDDVVSGPEFIEIEVGDPGTYRLEVRQIWGSGLTYELTVEARTAAEQRAVLDHRRAEEAAAGAWIAQNAIPLTTAEAGHGFADLEPLREVIGDARIVALGEATHGTREFFQLKHRMLEFLVTELGFDVFAIEATLPEALNVNRYVLTGEGDPARALAGMYFWIWDTEEVLELIRWMRRYNADPRHERKVSFYGVDMQSAPMAARVVVDYLRSVDPAAAAAADTALDPLADPYLAGDAGGWPAPQKQTLLSSIRDLEARFDSRRAEYVAQSSATRWDLARRHLHVLGQTVDMRTRTDASWARDSAMASNLAWALEREGAESKAVLWAHNNHVGTQPGTTGWQLRKWFGDALRTVGFAFERGEFQARDLERMGLLRAFRVEPGPSGSLDGQLAATGFPLAALDLRGIPEAGPASRWLDAPQLTRTLGSGYSEEHPEWYWHRVRARELYDALLFVRETSSARPNPTGHRPVQPRPADGPVNLDFEAGDPGEFPPGWTPPSGIAGVEWDVAVTREEVRQGDQAVVLRRAAGDRYGETAAELDQRVDATPWRGRSLTLTASVRIESTSPRSRGYLWMQVTEPAEPWFRVVFFDNMADRPITARDWREYEITATVPEDADSVSFGFAFVGPGRAWLDGVALESAAKTP
ncbi:MAG TPA: erythromycin esterase family protein [Longimicrobiales bacterium]|nr:erythromycin esterase family protein [Longimicrobiales bacterium]